MSGLENSHCEWLIQPKVENRSQVYISLQFSSVATECSYDYVFVYDGDSYHANLLASLSGRVRLGPSDRVHSFILFFPDQPNPPHSHLRLHAGRPLLRHQLRYGGLQRQLLQLALSQQLLGSRDVFPLRRRGSLCLLSRLHLPGLLPGTLPRPLRGVGRVGRVSPDGRLRQVPL